MLDGIEGCGAAIHPRRQLGIQRRPRAADALSSSRKYSPSARSMPSSRGELADQVLPRGIVELPAIQRLHRELARQRVRAGGEALRGLSGSSRIAAHPVCRSRAAISSAVSIASLPLFVPPGAARSTACSTFSTVSTPNDDRDAGIAAHVLQSARAFAGHVIEVRACPRG